MGGALMQIITHNIILEIEPGVSYYLALKDHKQVDRDSSFFRWEEIPQTHQAIVLAIYNIILFYLKGLEKIRGNKKLPMNPFFDTGELNMEKIRGKKK